MKTSTNKNMEEIPLLDNASNLEAGLVEMRNQNRPRDDQLRVLIFTAAFFILDGVTLTIRRIASHLRSKHAVVKIVTTVPKNFDRSQCDDDIIVVPSIELPLAAAGNGYSVGSGLHASTIREMEIFKPNIIHFTVPDFVGIDGVRWCQKNNVAYIGTWHSQYTDYLKYYYLEYMCTEAVNTFLRGFYETMPVVYVPTPYIMGKMKSLGFGVHSELKEWGRGVDLQLFNPNRRNVSFLNSKGISETDVVVLWVGRLVPEKRPDIYFDVLERLAEEGLPVKGLVVGHGSYEATLAELSHVKTCGWLSGTALAEVYASCDILLFPSAVETFGSVTLEGLASGCVCLVEELCGKHLVDNNYNGFTCPEGDLEAFYARTKELVVNEARRKQMKLNARETAQKFDRHVVLQQMLEYYKDAVVRHQDPNYLPSLMKRSPIVAGDNMFAMMCCYYHPLKVIWEPFLNVASSVGNFNTASQQCLKQSRSKLNLGDFLNPSTVDVPRDDSRFDQQEMGKQREAGTWANVLTPHNIIRFAEVAATCCSYIIVMFLIAATFLI